MHSIIYMFIGFSAAVNEHDPFLSFPNIKLISYLNLISMPISIVTHMQYYSVQAEWTTRARAICSFLLQAAPIWTTSLVI